MKKKFKYLLFGILLFIIHTEVKAASLGISSSSTNITVGQSVTIRVSANDLIGKFSVTSSNPSVLSGGTSSVWIESSSQSYTFTAKQAGSATITVLSISVADSNGNDFSGSKSITINVGNASSGGSNSTRQEKLSSDNTLSSLSIDNAEISPAFNKNTTDYTIELEAGTEKINVKATASDSTASITGTGEINVTEGSNNIQIVVTAQDGSTKTYTIKATVKEYDPIEVKVNGKKYTIVRNVKNIEKPSNYEETTIKIKGEEVPAFKNKITKYTLVILKDEKGNQSFYVYKNGKYTLYKEYTFNKVILYPLEMKKIPRGYKKVKIKLEDTKVVTYKLNKTSKFSLLYGMNIETGKKHIYSYDEEEGTLQIYNTEILKKSEKQLEEFKLIIAGLSGLTGFFFLILIINIAKNHKHNKQQKQIKKELKKAKKNSKKNQNEININQIM